MRKSVLTLFVFSALLISFETIAQDKSPVQFDFKAERLNDSLAKLVIHAKMEKSVQLFSVKKRGGDDPFVSSVHLDSTAVFLLHTTDTSTENGVLQLVKEAPGTNANYRLFSDSVSFEWLLHTKNPDSLVFKGSFAWLAKKDAEFPSGESNFTLKIPAAKTVSALATESKSEDSLWSIFLICLGTGLLAVITPCVFPLIPVTVSFFLKRSKSRAEGIKNAVWYSISIIAIYAIPTLLLTLAFGGKILYTISTSAVSNLVFFAIFLVFAISFFGAFELTLPNSWANKADEKAGKGGLMGIFFMALTLVIVSFSCTGPLVGTLLGQTSTNGVGSAPIIGMFGFGIGLALPFSLFAFFPSMLQSLPKSGGWLNSVKVTFGFIELALAMKFLSNVDLAYHWHLLDRDVFLVIWIVIFTLLGLYLLGKLKFSHDSDLPFISVPRLFFAIFSFCFALYMVPGLWGAPLKLLSGFIPPASTQEFNLEDLEYKLDNAHILSGKSGTTSASNNASVALPPKKYTDILEVPYGLTAYFDLDEGIAAAKVLNKPIMLDFTGHSCANCRKMEQEVWKNPEVLKLIREEFVLVSLYVDESKELPLDEQRTASNGDRIETVGNKNLEYETTKFGFNAQPLYKFLDLQGNPLSNVNYGYDPNVDKFIDHLKGVVQKFKSEK